MSARPRRTQHKRMLHLTATMKPVGVGTLPPAASACRISGVVAHEEPVGDMVSAQIEQQAVSRLAAHEIRYTKGRRQVIRTLARAEGPRSTSELHKDLKEVVPLSSLYRSLAVLTRVGVLSPHHGSGGIIRYELAEWLMGHHHHLVCDTCGGIDDIELPEDAEAVLNDVVSRATRFRDFVATGHSLEIAGRCTSCS